MTKANQCIRDIKYVGCWLPFTNEFGWESFAIAFVHHTRAIK